MSKHSHAAIRSIFAGIVLEHLVALRDVLGKLAAPRPTDEDLHQFRVTLRRLRSAWVTFAQVLPKSFEAEWKPRLRNLAASTGPVREWDVLLLDWLPKAGASLPADDEAHAWVKLATSRARAARGRAWRALRAELASPAVMEALTGLERAVAEFRVDVESVPYADFALARAAALRKVLLRRGRRPKRAPPERLHRARIAAKQWRYLYEAFYPALGVTAPKRRYMHLRKLQEALGEVHDADISLARAQDVAPEAPPASIVNAFHIRATAARGCAARELRWIRSHRAA
ncbi:CHAD domain-containing protein [Ralstonia sp. UBA689]|uniref:CHAD domain-containing protein n=1 Tax=Ralstonia sp. UBA689 TaxID=1947373 RepID=UPI0025FF8724|nr:CHAD domain-containing protein [Ralstonia sp. UBA689]